MKQEYENIKVLTAWDEGDDVKLACKLTTPDGVQRGTKTIKNVDWYFVIKASEYEKQAVKNILNRFYDAGVITKLDFYKEQWLRIFAKKTVQVDVKYGTGKQIGIRELLNVLRREGIETFEDDLSLWKRFMTDEMLEVAGDLSILYFDIETDDTQGGIEVGRDTILSWAAVNTAGEVFYSKNEKFGDPDAERKLLKEFLTVAKRHDLLCGWNSGGFDLPYIKGRMDTLGIDIPILDKKLHIDLMQRCARVYSYDMFNIGLKGFSLNEVSRVFLKEQKVDHKEGILEMYNNNPDLLKEYNIQDVMLLKRLDEKLLVTDLMIKECQWTGTFLDRFYIGELLDNYILRRSHELGFFQYSRPDWNKQQSVEDVQIRGGYVMSPIAGVYDNIRVCDFRSLYPSLMVGFNIGRDSMHPQKSADGFVALSNLLDQKKCKIEQLPYEEWLAFLRSEKKRLDPTNEYIQAANNTFYSKKQISFIGALVKHLLDLRAGWKAQAKTMPKDSPEYINIQQSQGIVKEMANSMYGITGDKTSRYFDLYVAEAITLTGQFINRTSSYFAEKRGFKTIYGDTDSIFLPVDSDEDMANLIVGVNSDLADFLENEIGVVDNIVLLQYEKKFQKLIMLDKKRYTGKMVLYDGNPTDKLFSRGTENVKKNTIKIARTAIVELINLIIENKTDRVHAKRWVEKLKNQLFYGDIKPEDIITMIKVSKSTDKYVAKPVHVRLAERLIAEGKLLPIVEGKRTWGTRLDYIIVKDAATGKQEGVLLEEFTGNWDKDYYWDVQVYAPIRRILEVAWPEEDWSAYEVGLSEKKEAEIQKRESKVFKILAAEAERRGKIEEATMKKEEKAARLIASVEAKREARRKKAKL